jgi:hypothetical protein
MPSTPVLIINIEGCQDHVFGYKCLRNILGSGIEHAEKWPTCQTKCFEAQELELEKVEE